MRLCSHSKAFFLLLTLFSFGNFTSLIQVNVNLAGLPALVLPCGFVEGGSAGLPVGLQMIGAPFDEVFAYSLT